MDALGTEPMDEVLEVMLSLIPRVVSLGMLIISELLLSRSNFLTVIGAAGVSLNTFFSSFGLPGLWARFLEGDRGLWDLGLPSVVLRTLDQGRTQRKKISIREQKLRCHRHIRTYKNTAVSAHCKANKQIKNLPPESELDFARVFGPLEVRARGLPLSMETRARARLFVDFVTRGSISRRSATHSFCAVALGHCIITGRWWAFFNSKIRGASLCVSTSVLLLTSKTVM